MIFAYEYSKFVTTSVLALMTLMSVALVIKPRMMALPYIASILLFTGTMYGAEDVTSTLYSRGVGVLGTPLINFFLLILFVFYFFYSIVSGSKLRMSKHPSFWPLCLIVAFYIIYLTYGISASLNFPNMLSNKGMINFVNLMMMLSVLSWAISEQRDLSAFRNVFFTATLLMCLFGIVRYFIGGGDPANFYKNFEQSSAKITFFDYGQLVLFTVLSVYCFFKRHGQGLGKQLFFLSIILFNIFNIMLSYRRNAILGLFFVLSWIFLISGLKKKILIFAALILMVSSSLIVLQKRFVQMRGFQAKNPGITADLLDRSGGLTVAEGRFYELYRAIQITNVSPIVGLGPWGINQPRVTRHERGDFVHSSFVHMYVKSGLAGLSLYFWMLLSFSIWWIRIRKQKWNNDDNRYLAEAFFCGFLFEIPDLIFGTPIIIYRHFQILAIVFAIPFICRLMDNRIGSDHSISHF